MCFMYGSILSSCVVFSCVEWFFFVCAFSVCVAWACFLYLLSGFAPRVFPSSFDLLYLCLVWHLDGFFWACFPFHVNGFLFLYPWGGRLYWPSVDVWRPCRFVYFLFWRCVCLFFRVYHVVSAIFHMHFLAKLLSFCSCDELSSCVCKSYASVDLTSAFRNCIRSLSGRNLFWVSLFLVFPHVCFSSLVRWIIALVCLPCMFSCLPSAIPFWLLCIWLYGVGYWCCIFLFFVWLVGRPFPLY